MAHLNHELVAAVRARDEKQVKALLALGATPDASDIIADRCVMPVLIIACNDGEAGIVGALLDEGASPNACMETVQDRFVFTCPALIAAMNCPNIVELLLRAGARANVVADWGVRQVSAWDYAKGDRNLQKLLSRYGARAA